MISNFLENKHSKIHFIGIGGISMSGLAEILLENGYKVSGSDKSDSAILRDLEEKGATIYIGNSAENIKDADLVVYTAAVLNTNEELIEAKNRGIDLMTRAEFLGQLMKGHKYNVAISGTHGKTTTTSFVSEVMLNAKLDPTILVGGNLDSINGNVRTGKSEYFIAEACEYKASFLKFFPYIGVILNIEADHLDFYKDIEEIQDTFLKFARLIPNEGSLIANFDDDRVKDLSKNVNCKVLSFGIENGDIRAKNISYNSTGCGVFDVYNKEEKLFSLELKVPGRHNILNSLAAISATLTLDVPYSNIKDGIESFTGTHRRFEKKGIKNGITVIDDYAHHPTEVKSVLSAAKNYPHKKVYCVFQPHTYTRTSTLFKDFSNSFSDCSELILMDIYAAREKDPGTISSKMLCDEIKKKGVNAVNIHDFEDAVKYLKDRCEKGDIILTVGAGDVYKIGEMFLK
ncbi:UDP-N-acetylmuramate--L-alanine ligase [Haloimpatiens sp. FM7315]|uniref:UDP-N-acetylmuramate--L-alanine ligase n=1 Tax=Haloimpatiens sp. FM7315 TaxID=3298609 RepID=UPI00370C6893